METQNNVTREREVASALLELRAVYTRVRLLLPSIPLEEVISLSGVVEQAVTLSMRKQQKELAKPLRPVYSSKSFPKGSMTQIDGDPKKTARGPMSVLQGKERVPVLTAVEEILTKEGPLTVPMIVACMKARGWRLFSMQKSHVGAIRGAMASEPKRFPRSGTGKQTTYRTAASKPVKQVAPTPDADAPLSLIHWMISVMPVNQAMNAEDILKLLKARHFVPNSADPAKYVRTVLAQNPKVFKRTDRGMYALRKSAKRGPGGEEAKNHMRVDVLRALAKQEEAISTPDLCKLVGVENGQSMSPLLNSLNEFGAVKKVEKDNATLWAPVKDKLKEYDAARGGRAFSNGHGQLVQA
jgi:hypothetical protein